jgi:hypothetical protein
MTMIHSCGKDDGGVSEALGFLLIFTMVIVGIGLVTLYGYPILIGQQVNADEKIMEKNMIVLQNDVKSLAYKTVPYKETSLKIGGGALTVHNTSSAISTIDILGCEPGGTTYVSAFKSGDVRYVSDGAGTDISLQNGAVVMRRHVEPGSVMLAEPRWFYDAPTNTMVINLIGINSTSIMSRAGIGTVKMAMGETEYMPFPAAGAPMAQLCVVYTTLDSGQDYSTAWNNYLTSTMDMACSGSSTLTCRFNKPIKMLVIKKYDVIIESL